MFRFWKSNRTPSRDCTRVRSSKCRSSKCHKRVPRRLVAEQLEARRTLATLTWVGDVDRAWFTQRGTNTNWDGDRLPADGDTLVFTAAGAGATTNDGPAGNSYTLDFRAGGHTVAGASIRLDNPGVDVTSVAGTVVLSLPLVLESSQVQVAGGIVQASRAISGSGGLEKSGAGTLRLDASNSFSGGFALRGGTVDVRSDQALGSGTFTIHGGTILAGGGARSLANAVQFRGDLTVGGSSNITLNAGRVGGIDLGSATRTVTVATASPSVFLDGQVSGGALAKLGPGRLALNRANSFAGPLTIGAGTVSFGDDGAAGAGTLIVLGGSLQADGATRTLPNRVEVHGDYSVMGTRGLTLQGPIDLEADRPVVRVDATTAHVWRGTVSGDGFVKAGAGTLVVEGRGNQISRLTTVAQGTLTLAADGALGDAALHLGAVDSGAFDSGAAPPQLVLAAGIEISNPIVVGLTSQTPASIQVQGSAVQPTRLLGPLELRQPLQLLASSGAEIDLEGPIRHVSTERGRLNIQGGGRVRLTNPNSDWRGVITASGEGTIVETGRTGGASVLRGAVAVNVEAGAMWRSLASHEWVAGLAGDGATEFSNRLEVRAETADQEFSGRLAGSGELVWRGDDDQQGWRWMGARVEVGAFTLARGVLELDEAARLTAAGDLRIGAADASVATLRLTLRQGAAAGEAGIRVGGAVQRWGDARLDLIPTAGRAASASIDEEETHPLISRSAGDRFPWRLADVDGRVLGEGAERQVDGRTLYLTYAGGDGNDLTLLRRPVLRGGSERDQFVAVWTASGDLGVALNDDAPVTYRASTTTSRVQLLGDGDELTIVASLTRLAELNDGEFRRLQDYLREPRNKTLAWRDAGESVEVELSGFASVRLCILEAEDWEGGAIGDELVDVTPPFVQLRSRQQLLVGSSTDEVIAGTNEPDLILGGPGNDRLAGGGGSDWIYGGAGQDQIWGEAAHDALFGGPGDDFLWGGAGNDTLDGGAGADQVSGDAGVDRLLIRRLEAVADVLRGGADFDDLEFAAETGEVALPRFSVAATSIERVLGNGQGWAGSDADDYISLAGLAFTSLSPLAYVDGRGGDDTLIGSAARDWLIGGAGDDLLSGGGGADRLDGGAGNDELRGDLGDDVLDGGIGVDGLYGDGGNDRFLVRADELVGDLVFGGGNTDRIVNVGQGDVLLSSFRGVTQAIEQWDGGGFGILGTEADDVLDFRTTPAASDAYSAETVQFTAVAFVDGRGGNDAIYGTNGDDRLRGGGGDDRLFGLHGDDRLEGGDDDDYLHGGAGGDRLSGELGADVLFGGAGVDRFVFAGDYESLDVIADDQHDLIDLSAYVLLDPLWNWSTTFERPDESSPTPEAARGGDLVVVGESLALDEGVRKRIRMNGATEKPAASRLLMS